MKTEEATGRTLNTTPEDFVAEMTAAAYVVALRPVARPGVGALACAEGKGFGKAMADAGPFSTRMPVK